MDEINIEDELSSKRLAMEKLNLEARNRPIGVEWAQLYDEILRLERLVAEKKGEPYAELWSIPELWAGMVYDCLVVGGQLKCSLIYEAKKIKPGKLKILEFNYIKGYKLTHVNDEVEACDGHPLSGRGLEAYGAFMIQRSPWLEEVERINSVHPQYDPGLWRQYNHYMLCLKETMFEVLAREVKLLGEADSREAAVAIALGANK